MQSLPLASIEQLTIEPQQIVFNQWNESVQCLVTAKLKSGELLDVTGFCNYTVAGTQAWASLGVGCNLLFLVNLDSK